MQVSHGLQAPPAPTGAGSQYARYEPSKAPTISGEMSPAKWRSFGIFWGKFKQSVGLSQEDTPKESVTNRL